MRLKHLSWAAIPVLNVLQQVFLKLGAAQAATETPSSWAWQVMIQPWFLAAVIAEAVCFLIWMTVLAESDLSRAFPLSAVSYILIITSAWMWFGETMTPLQILGSALILSGIVCIATADSSKPDLTQIRNSP